MKPLKEKTTENRTCDFRSSVSCYVRPKNHGQLKRALRAENENLRLENRAYGKTIRSPYKTIHTYNYTEEKLQDTGPRGATFEQFHPLMLIMSVEEPGERERARGKEGGSSKPGRPPPGTPTMGNDYTGAYRSRIFVGYICVLLIYLRHIDTVPGYLRIGKHATHRDEQLSSQPKHKHN